MARKKILMERIQDDKQRRIIFKKRRLGLLKKAIEISKLSDCVVHMKIYNKEDNSLMEFFTNERNELDQIDKNSSFLSAYIKFACKDNDLIEQFKRSMMRKYDPWDEIKERQKMLGQIEEGFNVKSFFSMSKCTQHHEDSSVGEGAEINDDVSSIDDLIEPKQKQKMQKRIFETNVVKVKSDLEIIPENSAADLPSFRPNS